MKEFYGHVYKCHSDLNLDSCPYKSSFTDTLNCNTLNFVRYQNKFNFLEYETSPFDLRNMVPSL